MNNRTNVVDGIEIYVTLPMPSDDCVYEEREYIVTSLWTNGSGERWCDAHYFVDGRKREVMNWSRIQQLAKIADKQLVEA